MSLSIEAEQSLGIYRELLDIPVVMKFPCRQRMRLFRNTGREDDTFYQHDILQVKLKDGVIYFVDLAGAQYGFYESVVPSAMYMETRAESILEGRPFGYYRSYLEKSCDDGDTWKSAIRRATECMYKVFNSAIETFEKEVIPLKKMMTLKENAYLTSQKELLGCVQQIVGEYKRLADERGDFKVDAGIQARINQHERERLEKKTYNEEVAEFLANASSKGHEILDMRGLSL